VRERRLAGPYRFSRIGYGIGALSDRTLSVRLSELESHGIMERRAHRSLILMVITCKSNCRQFI